MKSSTDETINEVIEKINTSNPNKYKIESKNDTKEFNILVNDNEKILIHDYCDTGIQILNLLSGIEAKVIIYDIDIKNLCISVLFIDNKNSEFKISDFDLDKENITFIQESINVKKEIITISENSNNIQVFFLGKLIYDTKDGKNKIPDYCMKNLSSSEEDINSQNTCSEEQTIKPYNEVLKETISDENTIESDNSSEEEIIKSIYYEIEEYDNKKELLPESNSLQYKDKMLINPVLLINKSIKNNYSSNYNKEVISKSPCKEENTNNEKKLFIINRNLLR